MSQTSDRYAKALFELAREENSLELVQSTLTDIRKLILNLADIRLFLTNPLLDHDERCSILKALFEGKVPALVYKFLLFLIYKGRLDILKSIIESFDNLYLINTHHVRAYVTTAQPLDEGDKNFINQRLHDKFKQSMMTTWKTDASLIGGFRIFVQGKVYDYSFKNQLNSFSQSIA